MSNMKAKIKKHQVLDGKIKANGRQLKPLNKTGQAGEERFKTFESLAKRLDTLDKDASSRLASWKKGWS